MIEGDGGGAAVQKERRRMAEKIAYLMMAASGRGNKYELRCADFSQVSQRSTHAELAENPCAIRMCKLGEMKGTPKS